MEYVSGNIYIRPNPMNRGHRTHGHGHNFDHTTFFQAGWHLCRRTLKDGSEIVTQHCSIEHRLVRELLQKYEPQSIKRPVRGPDRVEESDGRPYFNIQFIEQDDAVPEGFEEILFDPLGYHVLSEANVLHEFISLSDNAELNCVYSHRDPQGKVVQVRNGFEDAYR